MVKKFHRISRANTAQAMVEFALAIPFLLTMILGIFEFAHLLSFVSGVYSAAREGARYGSASGYYTDCAGITEAANRVGLLAKPLTVDIGYNIDSNPSVGDPASYASSNKCGNFTIDPESNAIPRIVVKVTAQYHLIALPNFSFIGMPTSFPVSSQSARTIISEVQYTEKASASGGPTATSGASATATSAPPTATSEPPTPTETPSETPSETPIPPTPIPYCLFLSADSGVLNNQTTSQSYIFYIRNSNPVVSAVIDRITVQWGGWQNVNRWIALTEIDYANYKTTHSIKNPPTSIYDSGTISGGPTVPAATSSTPPPADFQFLFTAANQLDHLTIAYAKIYLTYQDPGTLETVHCSLQPGYNAVKVP